MAEAAEARPRRLAEQAGFEQRPSDLDERPARAGVGGVVEGGLDPSATGEADGDDIEEGAEGVTERAPPVRCLRAQRQRRVQEADRCEEHGEPEREHHAARAPGGRQESSGHRRAERHQHHPAGPLGEVAGGAHSGDPKVGCRSSGQPPAELGLGPALAEQSRQHRRARVGLAVDGTDGESVEIGEGPGERDGCRYRDRQHEAQPGAETEPNQHGPGHARTSRGVASPARKRSGAVKRPMRDIHHRDAPHSPATMRSTTWPAPVPYTET